MTGEKKIEVWVDNINQKSAIGHFVIGLLRKLHISQTIRKIWVYKDYNKDKKSNTSEMQEARDFFEKNKTEIRQILSILEDEKSRQIYKSLIKFRCTHDVHYLSLYSIRDQYFPKDIISLSENEVFVDCGAFSGDTYDIFKKRTNNKFKKYICFEPDDLAYKSLQKRIKNDARVVSIKKGVWDTATTLVFEITGSMNGKIIQDDSVNKDNKVVVDVCRIDDIEECKKVSFIKMDIEGAELKALKGAENIIRENRPKLAICIYHSNEDFIQIIKWIYELGLEYKIYVRHHNFDICETVVYAV